MPSFGNYDPRTFGWTYPAPAGDIVPFTHRGVPFPNGVNVAVAPLFRAALDLIAPRLPGGLVTPGCWGFNDRPVTGGGAPSFHAYGLAIDVNAPTNPYLSPDDWAAGKRSAPHTIPDDTGAQVRGLGMEWGGDWTGLKDYMHLEVHLTPAEAATMARGFPVDVLDYSSGWPAPSAIKATRYVGIVRYIGTPGRSKNLTRTEASAMRAAGIPIALVYEDTAGWMTRGAGAGESAARAALADAADCGVGVRNVYFACDVDVTSAAQMGSVADCLDGAARVLGRARTGVYGEADVIDAMLGAGHATWGWQTRAWSGGRLSARAHLLQQIGYVSVGGVQCDRNTVLNDDWGQWPGPTEEDDVGAEDVWDFELEVPAANRALFALPKYPAADWLRGPNIRAALLAQQVSALSGAITALSKLVGANEANDLTAEQVEAAAKAGAEAALQENVVQVDVEVHGQQATPTEPNA